MSNEVKIERSSLPEKVLKYADLFKKNLTITDTGVVELPKDIYEKTLEGVEGVTLASITKAQAHNTDVLAGLSLAVAEAAPAFVKKHKGINELTAEFKAGKDTLGTVYTHTKEVRIPPAKAGEEATMQVRHGQLRSFYDAYAAGNNRGSLKKVREFVSQTAAAAAAG